MNGIQAYTTTLSKANAYWMARIADQVYTIKSGNDPAPDKGKIFINKKDGDAILAPDEDEILSNLKEEDSGFISVFGASKNSAQAVLIEHEQYFCLAFRGTDEPRDWLDNLSAFPKRELFGEFHGGFWNSVDDVWGKLHERYTSLKKEKSRPLFLTGHSLGGAMATIAAAKLIHIDSPFISVYTFGQPRVMTPTTARIFNMEARYRFFRFHNNNDIVARMPSRLMNYSHVGSFIYISEDREIHNDVGFWYRFLDSVDGSVRDLIEPGLDGVKDHDMKSYLHAIKMWNYKS